MKGAFMFAGLVIILVGIIFLLQNLGILNNNAWDIVWPAIIVLLGISILVKPYYHYNQRVVKEDKKSKKD